MGSFFSKELYDAVWGGDEEKVCRLLETSSSTRKQLNSTTFFVPKHDATFWFGRPSNKSQFEDKDLNLLHFFILRQGNQFMKSALLACNCGLDKNAIDSLGYTPLHLAIATMIYSCQESKIDWNLNNCVSVIKLIINHKTGLPKLEPELEKIAQVRADVNMKTKNFVQETPLHIACRVGCSDWFLASDSSNDKFSPTHDVLIELLANGADVSATDFLGRTPLHYACISLISPPTILAELLTAIVSSTKAESILNAVDKHGLTALHYACFLLQKEKVALLLAQPLIDWELPVGAARNPDTHEIDQDKMQVRVIKMVSDQQEEDSDYNEMDVDKVCKIEPFLHLQRVFSYRAFGYLSILGLTPIMLAGKSNFQNLLHCAELGGKFTEMLRDDKSKAEDYEKKTCDLFTRKLVARAKPEQEKEGKT